MIQQLIVFAFSLLFAPCRTATTPSSVTSKWSKMTMCRTVGVLSTETKSMLLPCPSTTSARSVQSSILKAVGAVGASLSLFAGSVIAADVESTTPNAISSSSSSSSSSTDEQEFNSPATTSSSSSVLPTSPGQGFQTKSGLKYFDFVQGTGASPRYGQLISFHYTTYYRPTPDSSLYAVDTLCSSEKTEVFLHKHGNGRLVRGLDEGLHTMKVGGKRRLVVPKNIGYTELGLGPVPSDPSQRRKLGTLLDELVADRGELLFDVELCMVADDENDQGYYDDEPVTQEEVRKLILKSLGTQGNNPELMDTMFKTTPDQIFQK